MATTAIPTAADGKSERERDEYFNSRGIPVADFVSDVDAYVTKADKDIDAVLKDLHMLYQKYKFMETQLVTQKRSVTQKIPDIKSALGVLEHLVSKQDDGDAVRTTYQLADNVYAHADIDCTAQVVYLWLGANVMLEYSYEEATALLQKNLANCTSQLSTLNSDLQFLKDQITTSEVNIARVHNYRVKLKKKLKAEAAAGVAAAGATS